VLVTVVEHGLEVVRVRRHEAVEVVEALAGGPVREGSPRGNVPERGMVPLTQREGGVPALAQDLGHAGCRLWHPPRGVSSQNASV